MFYSAGVLYMHGMLCPREQHTVSNVSAGTGRELSTCGMWAV